MAGEWIAYDISLPSKPEVQELLDTTDLPVEVVVFRILQLWGWASIHCADGTAKMTVRRLARTCGGNEAFWLAVAAVGWLEIDEDCGTVAVPGWDRRFSQAAKARRDTADRVRDHRERKKAGVARSVSPGRKEQVVKRFLRTCVYCGVKDGQSVPGGRRVEMHVDHLVPVSNGGSNDDRNLVCSCNSCNLAKGDRTVEECGVFPAFLPAGVSIERDGNGIVTGVTVPVTEKRYQIEEIEERRIPPPPREAAPAGAWDTLRTAWNTGAGKTVRRQPWKPASPPDHAATVMAATGWLAEALEAIPRLASCRYFDSPVTLHQFTVEGFVTKVLGGQYDAPKTPKGAAAVEERPRAVGWTGSDAARLQATIDKQRAVAGGPA